MLMSKNRTLVTTTITSLDCKPKCIRCLHMATIRHFLTRASLSVRTFAHPHFSHLRLALQDKPRYHRLPVPKLQYSGTLPSKYHYLLQTYIRRITNPSRQLQPSLHCRRDHQIEILGLRSLLDSLVHSHFLTSPWEAYHNTRLAYLPL
jgi:hypothetical protein